MIIFQNDIAINFDNVTMMRMMSTEKGGKYEYMIKFFFPGIASDPDYGKLDDYGTLYFKSEELLKKAYERIVFGLSADCLTVDVSEEDILNEMLKDKEKQDGRESKSSGSGSGTNAGSGSQSKGRKSDVSETTGNGD